MQAIHLIIYSLTIHPSINARSTYSSPLASLAGKYEVLLTSPGTLYYWSGFMDAEDYSMRGTIEVTASVGDDVLAPLTLKLGDIEADYDFSGESAGA
jgi:hypothetical protein